MVIFGKKFKEPFIFWTIFQACCSFLSGAFIMLEKTKRSSLDLPIMVFYKNTLQMVVIFSLLKIHGFSGSPIALEEL